MPPKFVQFATEPSNLFAKFIHDAFELVALHALVDFRREPLGSLMELLGLFVEISRVQLLGSLVHLPHGLACKIDAALEFHPGAETRSGR